MLKQLMKIVPKIYNGRKMLVLSESFFIESQAGATIEVPLNAPFSGTSNNLILSMDFIEDGGSKKGFEIFLSQKNTLLINCHNLAGQEWGNSAPNQLRIGNVHFEIWLGLYPFGKTAHKVTISIYEVPTE